MCEHFETFAIQIVPKWHVYEWLWIGIRVEWKAHFGHLVAVLLIRVHFHFPIPHSFHSSIFTQSFHWIAMQQLHFDSGIFSTIQPLCATARGLQLNWTLILCHLFLIDFPLCFFFAQSFHFPHSSTFLFPFAIVDSVFFSASFSIVRFLLNYFVPLFEWAILPPSFNWQQKKRFNFCFHSERNNERASKQNEKEVAKNNMKLKRVCVLTVVRAWRSQLCNYCWYNQKPSSCNDIICFELTFPMN